MTQGGTLEKEEIKRIFFGFAIEAEKQISTHIKKPKQKVVILAGPTCSGKTALSIDFAKMIGGEIISADSMQVYRGMDIGTAKATSEQRAEVPHHLVDIRDITEPYNVVDFYYEARQCCQSILARNKTPIFVGGSGFYLHAILYGPPSGPPSVPEVRESTEEEMEQKGAGAMYEKLKGLDPKYAGSITKNDKQKIVRGLEIIALTGKEVSKLAWKARRKPQNYDFHCWFLHRPKESLYAKIDARCDEMLQKGFVEEVERLLIEGIRSNSSAVQAIGYRQVLDFLETGRSDADYAHFVDAFKRASRNYAKRQFTWFRREELFRWLDLDLHDYEVALEMVRRDFEAF